MSGSLNRVGYACMWGTAPEDAWSGTTWAMMSAMRRQVDVVDLGTHLSPWQLRRWRLASLRRRNGEWNSDWGTSAKEKLLRDLRRNPLLIDCDAVFQIHALAVVDRPYFVYCDFTPDMISREVHRGNDGIPYFYKWALDTNELQRRRDSKVEVFTNAAGVIAMSAHCAESLVHDSGVAPEKVHVAYPGATAITADTQRIPRRQRESPRKRLLFVGTNFMVKGGDIVVRAFEILRRSDPSLTLTVVGPQRWPLNGPIPDGVDFKGRVPRSHIVSLMDQHDLLVMPSRLEGFGLVFIEAMARGLVCIGRNAFAMPELIEPGVTGGLLDSLEPTSLAQLIAEVLADDAIYAEVDRRAPEVARRFTWDNTAARMIDVMTRTCG
jgi:glycosyltransferase involved in cell wall biosynthesis